MVAFLGRLAVVVAPPVVLTLTGFGLGLAVSFSSASSASYSFPFRRTMLPELVGWVDGEWSDDAQGTQRCGLGPFGVPPALLPLLTISRYTRLR